MLEKMRTGQVRTSQDRLKQVRTGQVRADQDLLGRILDTLGKECSKILMMIYSKKKLV